MIDKKNINKIVFVLIILALILFIIFVIQNSEKSTITFLGCELSLPMSVIVISVFVVGFICGLIYDAIVAYKSRKRKHEQQLMNDYVQRVEKENQALKEKNVIVKE